ncbi:Similar to Vegetative incompatibility protein HET-E-1; acc. no. Q00808 [Pyronema omphalodes CBS 100304]|uniref:Similar to Vegetative incompatibility protein HET-E-1 acc. no. Q00808 n=1 Tax=Pyronema omphalodes (strain CBS 100304) TaxID=1076935 RepID=U4LV90_PYROM|nr:Similar to Vegetative incompatibility protein HET-E-1; acc. no. Q00808 [Pyronema omphalodes CBS 100304]
MQDENRFSIDSYTRCFLKDDLMFSDDLLQAATDYILETAQGVSLWVSVVKAELQRLFEDIRYSKNEVMDALKGLPKELKGLYDKILKRLSEARNQDTAKIFFIVLAANRLFSVDELQHSLAVSTDVEEEDKFTPSVKFLTDQLIEGIEKRIIHCCGNLIEVKKNPRWR